TNSWSRGADFLYKRWYPSILTLPDGRVILVSGSHDGAITNLQPIPELYDPVANTWTQLNSANKVIEYYPFLYVIPDGRLIQVGATEHATNTLVMNLSTFTWTTLDAAVIDAGSSTMYLPGRL